LLKSESISHAVDVFVEILSQTCDCYVSSTLPSVRHPAVWWNGFCQCTYKRKLQAWSRCDWPAYHTSVFAAKWAQAIAFHHRQRFLLTKLQLGSNDCLWWNLTKNISGLCKTYNLSAPDVDILASYFSGKLSLSANFDPNLSVVPPEVSNVTYKKFWRVKLSKVHSVLRSVDVKKAVGPDGVSPYILKYCCEELCYPVCLLFHRVCRAREFPLSWKVSHITPVYKCKGSATDPRFYRLIAVLPTLAMVFECA